MNRPPVARRSIMPIKVHKTYTIIFSTLFTQTFACPVPSQQGTSPSLGKSNEPVLSSPLGGPPPPTIGALIHRADKNQNTNSPPSSPSQSPPPSNHVVSTLPRAHFPPGLLCFDSIPFPHANAGSEHVLSRFGVRQPPAAK